MLAFIFALFASTSHVESPVGRVEVITGEFDAIWVPEGVTGPVVAVPFDEIVFEVTGE